MSRAAHEVSKSQPMAPMLPIRDEENKNPNFALRSRKPMPPQILTMPASKQRTR